MSQEYSHYNDMFTLVLGTPLPQCLQKEYDEYMVEPLPENQDIEALEYWNSLTQSYPNLSLAALRLLSIPVSSASVERSFSQIVR